MLCKIVNLRSLFYQRNNIICLFPFSRNSDTVLVPGRLGATQYLHGVCRECHNAERFYKREYFGKDRCGPTVRFHRTRAGHIDS